MKKKPETYNRAKIEILNYIVCFSTYTSYDSGINSFPLSRDCTFMGNGEPEKGDLIKLSCAGFSKYYLSWLIEIRERNGWREYLLKSIEDGSLCWWSNVGIHYYSREGIEKFPNWKWNDAQFEFADKWQRACKRRDAYILLPTNPKFNEDGSVILRCRVRYGLNPYSPEKTFPNWRKMKVSEMLEFYDNCKIEFDNMKTPTKTA